MLFPCLYPPRENRVDEPGGAGFSLVLPRPARSSRRIERSSSVCDQKRLFSPLRSPAGLVALNRRRSPAQIERDMTELNESDFPVLYAHGTRKDWGTGVLAGERDGKRTYLFEGGEERVMGGGAHDMMRKVSPMTSENQATLARLTALVARRRGLPDPSKAAGFVLAEQLTDLRHSFT